MAGEIAPALSRGETDAGTVEQFSAKSCALRRRARPARGMLRFQHARQAFRVRRRCVAVKTGKAEEIAYGICSVAAERAGPERLLTWNRGHWMIEKPQPPPPRRQLGRGRLPRPPRAGQQRRREQHRHRYRPEPRLRFVPEALDHFSMRREDAFNAVLSPG